VVIENLILPSRHASHRGSALPACHPFSNLRVFRPLTRRLDRSPLSSPTILQPFVREREREREREKREEGRVVVVVGGKGGLRTQARSRVWPAPACRASPGLPASASRNWVHRPSRRVPPGLPASAARPIGLTGRRGASHRAHRPSRRVPPGLPAVAARPTGLTGRRDASHRAHRPLRRVPPGLPASASRLTAPGGPRATLQQETTCLTLCQGLLGRRDAAFQTSSQGRTLHTVTTVFTTEKWAVSRGRSRAVVGLVGVVAGPARNLHSVSAPQPARLALHTV